MEKLNNPSEFSLILKYALKDLSRNYHKISSIIVTLFISLFILSAIFTIDFFSIILITSVGHSVIGVSVISDCIISVTSD